MNLTSSHNAVQRLPFVASSHSYHSYEAHFDATPLNNRMAGSHHRSGAALDARRTTSRALDRRRRQVANRRASSRAELCASRWTRVRCGICLVCRPWRQGRLNQADSGAGSRSARCDGRTTSLYCIPLPFIRGIRWDIITTAMSGALRQLESGGADSTRRRGDGCASSFLFHQSYSSTPKLSLCLHGMTRNQDSSLLQPVPVSPSCQCQMRTFYFCNLT